MRHIKEFFLHHKRIRFFLFFFLLLYFGAFLSGKAVEPLAHITPDYPKEEIIPIFLKDKISKTDYEKILFQTGLGKVAVDQIREIKPKIDTIEQSGFSAWKRKIERLQECYFKEVIYTNEANTLISCEERLIDQYGNHTVGIEFVNIEDGDILVTKSSRVYGWRNGHAALVVDAEKGKIIESVVLGENSCIQNIKKWRYFPNVMIFRLKGASEEHRKRIADWTMQNLENIPYRFSVGVLSNKEGKEGTIEGTQCAHLVWAAFHQFGYDLDSDGGKIVTPKDLANSSWLEIVQLYGVDPREPWK